MKKKTDYINNAKFYDTLVQYYKKKQEAIENNKPIPQIPDEIGLAIIQISKRLSTRFNFSGYSFREEMIGDGILNGLEAVKSFNPEKSKNPFAYFTQIIYRAFLRRIDKEKSEYEVKMNYNKDVTSILFDDDVEMVDESWS